MAAKKINKTKTKKISPNAAKSEGLQTQIDDLNLEIRSISDSCQRQTDSIWKELGNLNALFDKLNSRQDRIESDSRKFRNVVANAFNNVRLAFATPESYTQSEIDKMSSDEYREKILKPLRMAKVVY
jgi:TolA-binding protein